uniref:Uncharacterized protein n=1 Tax=Cacopsylla melanoneura TaxID=428564 RepID=A0A8D8YNT8_9HEMI
MGSAQESSALFSLAHALVYGGARHLFHAGLSLLLLHAGQVCACSARSRNSSGGCQLRPVQVVPGRVGSHIPRRQSQHGSDLPQVQVGYCPDDTGVPCHAHGDTYVAYWHGNRTSQSTAVLLPVRQDGDIQRGASPGPGPRPGVDTRLRCDR